MHTFTYTIGSVLACCCVLSGAAAGRPQDIGLLPEIERTPSISSEQQILRQELARQTADMVQQLKALETNADYTLLLQRKLTVDCTLAPLLFLQDAAGFTVAQEAGRNPYELPDLLRLLRTEYAAEPCHAEWSAPDGAARVAAALRSMNDAEGSLSAWQVAAWASVGTSTDHPPFILWTCAVQGGQPVPAVEAQAHWYEPCMDFRTLDWPLSPLGTTVTWDAHGGSILTGRGVTHSEKWPAEPLFNNPDDLYVLFDTLRAHRCADLQWARSRGEPASPADSSAAGTTTPGSRAASHGDVITRIIRRADGSMVRKEEWCFAPTNAGGAGSAPDARKTRGSGGGGSTDGAGETMGRMRLVELRLTQPPLQLLHHHPFAYDIHERVDGNPADESQMLAPHSYLTHPPLGLECRVTFRPMHSWQDDVDAPPGNALANTTAGGPSNAPASDPTAVLPHEMTLTSGGRPVGGATFLRMARGEHAPQALAQWRSEAAAQAAARLECMNKAERACAAGDLEEIRATLRQTRQLGKGIPEAWHLANIQACVCALERAGFPDAARELARQEWLVAALTCPVPDRDQAIGAALRARSPTLAAVVVDSLGAADETIRSMLLFPQVPGAGAERLFFGEPADTLGNAEAACTPPCNPDDLPPAMQELFQAIRATLAVAARPSAAGDPPLLTHAQERMLTQCACRALHEAAAHPRTAPPGASSLQTEEETLQLLAQRTSKDLLCLMRLGAGEFATRTLTDPDAACLLCARFEQRLSEALYALRWEPTPQELCAAWDRVFAQCAVAARDLARELAQEPELGLRLDPAHVAAAGTRAAAVVEELRCTVCNAYQPGAFPYPPADDLSTARIMRMVREHPWLKVALHPLRVDARNPAALPGAAHQSAHQQALAMQLGELVARVAMQTIESDSSPKRPPSDSPMARPDP